MSGTRPLSCENVVNVVVSNATRGPVLSSPGRPPPPSPNSTPASGTGAPARTSGPACSGCGCPACRRAPCSRSARSTARERSSPNRWPLIEHVPATTPSAGVFLAQRLDVVALVLPRDDQRPVLLERARIDQLVDVLARHSIAGLPPPRDGLGPVLVERERVPRDVLAQIGPDVVGVEPCCRRRRRPRPRPAPRRRSESLRGRRRPPPS